MPLAAFPGQTSRRLCYFVTPAKMPLQPSKTRCLFAWSICRCGGSEGHPRALETALCALAVYSLNCPCTQVLELVRRVSGPDALHWTTRLDVMDQMQTSEVYTNWVRSGFTREQFVQFVHRRRIKALKGEERSLNPKSTRHLSQAGAFAVPKGWHVLPGPSADRSTKKKRKIAHRFSTGWSVGTLLPKITRLKKQRQGRGIWVRYHSKETGKSEDWLHDCNDSDYARSYNTHTHTHTHTQTHTHTHT